MLLQILDVQIALTVLYLVFSTVASAAAELVEAVMRRRGSVLMQGIEELFAAAQTNGSVTELVKAFYNSPHIASLFGGTVTGKGGWLLSRWKVSGGRLPSYITAERFAAAIQSLSRGEPTVGIAQVPDEVRDQFKRIADVALSLSAGAAPSVAGASP